MRRILRWLARSLVVGVLALAGLGVAAWLAFGLVPAIGTPSIAAVHRSLIDEVGGSPNLADDGCRAAGRRAWRCNVADPSSSGAVDYRVRRRGTRCWDAWLLSPPTWWEGEGAPARASGCVTLGDQL